MSRTDTCLICGRTGHTSSSCPHEAKRRREQGGRAHVALLLLVAALAFTAGLSSGRAVDAAIVSVMQMIEPIRTHRAPPKQSRWFISVRTWMLDTHHYEIDAIYPESAAACVDAIWPDYRGMLITPARA